MTDIAKLENWIKQHPEEADEPFMNVSTQRKVTLKGVYEELQKEQETGVAVVDEDLLNVIRDVDDWLKEI